MTMSTVDHHVASVFTGKVVVDSPKSPATVINLDTTPVVDGLRDLTRAVDSLRDDIALGLLSLKDALGKQQPPSVILEPTIEVSSPEIHIPEPKVIIQRVDGQIITQNLAVKKIHLVLLALPYVYILAEILRKIM